MITSQSHCPTNLSHVPTLSLSPDIFSMQVLMWWFTEESQTSLYERSMNLKEEKENDYLGEFLIPKNPLHDNSEPFPINEHFNLAKQSYYPGNDRSLSILASILPKPSQRGRRSLCTCSHWAFWWKLVSFWNSKSLIGYHFWAKILLSWGETGI